MSTQLKVSFHPTTEWRRTMVLSVAATLFLGVILWAALSAREVETLLTTANALGAAVAAGLAWRRYILSAAILLTLALALVPIVGFATAASTTSPITELLWLALAFSVGGVIIPGRFSIPTLLGLWLAASALLLANQAIPWTHASEAVVGLGMVCIVSCVISYLGNRLEAQIKANHRRLAEAQAHRETQNLNLDAALLREQSLSRLKEEFLASFSHELRTPLNAILGLSEALQEDVYGPLSEKQRRSLETIESSGRHLFELLSDILDLARIGAGKLPTSIQPCDVAQLVQVAAYSTQEQIADKRLKMDITLPDGDMVVHTDVSKCQRILKCLLSNAIKFTDPGGEIGIEVTQDAGLDAIRFDVWDRGIGIADDKLRRLSTPFEQSDSGLSRRHDGLGLGLALATKLSHLIGATLHVESTLGEGSRFTLMLRRNGPRRITLYGDLNCPFSYTLNEWFEQAQLGHLVLWQGVEHMADLTCAQAKSEKEQASLTEELDRLNDRASRTFVEIKRPPFRPNSHLGLVALLRVEERCPERAVEARRLLFRALWRAGEDISDPKAVHDLLADFDLGDMSEISEEERELAAQTNAWRSEGHSTIPMAVAHGSAKIYEGLGHRGLLLAYLGDEFGLSYAALDGPQSSDLTGQLIWLNIQIRRDLEELLTPEQRSPTNSDPPQT